MEHEHQNNYIATNSGLFCKECGFLDEYMDMNNISVHYNAASNEPFGPTTLNTNIEQTDAK